MDVSWDRTSDPPGIRPEPYSDEWRALPASGVRSVTLRAAGHSSATATRDPTVPDRIVGAWHGQDETTMRGTYSHALAERGAHPV